MQENPTEVILSWVPSDCLNQIARRAKLTSQGVKACACGCDERSNNNSARGLLKQERGVAGVTNLSPSLGVTRVAGKRFTSQIGRRTLAELVVSRILRQYDDRGNTEQQYDVPLTDATTQMILAASPGNLERPKFHR